MTEHRQHSSAPGAGGMSPVFLRWLVLVILSSVVAAILNAAGMPAATLLGAMLAGIIVAFRGVRLSVPGPVFALAQGLIGCMIAGTFPESLSGDLLEDWPLLVFGVLSVIAASALLGWLLTRMRILPGTTVVWGLSPGAASAMVLLSDSYGADSRLVAFMQYTRVLMVTAAASLIATAVGSAIPHDVSAQVWFPPIAWWPLAETLALAVAGPLIARLIGMPALGLLLPIIGGVLLTRLGVMELELPHWLLALAFAFVGWRIGLPFTRPLILHALKMLPMIAASTLCLMTICAGLAAVFVLVAGIDPLTAYLATSPGGADSVAIIAASSDVDAPFVISMQLARFTLILFFGPILARFVARRAAMADPGLDPDGKAG